MGQGQSAALGSSGGGVATGGSRRSTLDAAMTDAMGGGGGPVTASNVGASTTAAASAVNAALRPSTSTPEAASTTTSAASVDVAVLAAATVSAAALTAVTTGPAAAAAAAGTPAAMPATTATPATSGATAGAQRTPSSGHKTTTLIPGWSRQLSSQSLVIECQKIQQPLRVAGPRESFGVLEMEVMKFVAYCGGVTVKFRVDELTHGPVDSIAWGLASTRPCPALLASQTVGANLQQPGTSPAASAMPLGTASLSSSASAAAQAVIDAVKTPLMAVAVGSGGQTTSSTPTAQAGGASPSGSMSSMAPAGLGGLALERGHAVGQVSAPASAQALAAALAASQGSKLQLLPNAGVPVDSLSRKPLYMICSTYTHRLVVPGDILSIDLAPREDKQPVIMATLRLNDIVMLQSSLPCNTISSLQMYPFISLLSGMAVSLHEAVTPSPLFTWYHPAAAPAPEATFCELDTCVKYHNNVATAPVPLPPGLPPPALPMEFLGSTTFTAGRHRWTVQLDNYSPTPTHIYVGVAGLEPCVASGPSSSGTVSSGAPALVPLCAITGQAPFASRPAASLGSVATALQQAGLPRPQGLYAPSARASGPASTSNRQAPMPAAGLLTSDASALMVPQRPLNKWGAWIRLPAMGVNPSAGSATHQAVLPLPPLPRPGHHEHSTESTSSHCFVTVDLDLSAGYVRFFRNGHLIGSAFTSVTGPVSPSLCFIPSTSLHCQGGLVNLTKLRQLDLRWNADKCSGDLRLSGMMVSKVSEVFGDYSTVLADQGFISGVHLWLVKVNNLSEPDSIFIGVCRGCMPLDQDPQDLRDRTYYLSNGVIRVGGRRVATNSANFAKGDIVGVVLDADQGEIVFFRNGLEQGRARGIRGRLYPFVSCDSEADQITLLGSYDLLLNRTPRQLADMEWDTLHHAPDVELSSNCLTATKTSSNSPSTVRGTILYSGTGCHEFHVILDALGPDGVWVGVAPINMDHSATVGDYGFGWALHSDGDKRYGGKEEEYTQAFKNGDVLTVCLDMSAGTLRFSRNGAPLGQAFSGLVGPLVAAITLASEESKITIQNRPTVLNTGEYTGELRWDEARAGKDLHVIDGLTVTKMANEGGDYATVLGTLCLASGQHTWNIYINHVEDSNLFIGVTVGGHDLNADPQEMKHRTYYLSNGTIRVAGKLVTRCAEPYAEGDLVSVQLDMETRHIAFLKNGVLQGAGDGLPEELWPYVSLDNIMDSITLHSSNMFVDLAHSLRWNAAKCSRIIGLAHDGQSAQLRGSGGNLLPADSDITTQASVLGLREYNKTEVHSWIVRFEQAAAQVPANFLLGVAPPGMELARSLGEENCGIGLDLYGYFYVNGRYFHVSNLSTWAAVAKPVRGSTAKHKGKATAIFTFTEGRCEVTLTLDLKEGTLKFAHGGRCIGTIAGVKGPLHAAVTLTSPRQTATLAPGPIGKSEHTNEELVNVLKAKGIPISSRLEAALLLIPRDLFVPRDRHREAFRDQKVTVRMVDGSTMTLPPPSHVATALERMALTPGTAFLDVGCGTGYVTALAACMLGHSGVIHGIECVSSRLETSRANMKALKERIAGAVVPGSGVLGDPLRSLATVDLQLSNVLIPECTDGQTYDAIYCDACISEEDLPMFLSLLRPGGRMSIIIDEEALLVSRTSGSDPHDFQREVMTQVSGEYGELEAPTPWEVQQSIQRIKERERRKGHEQARSEVASLRNFEYAEMQQRVTGAMQRIADLEALLLQQRSEYAGAERGAAGGRASPGRASISLSHHYVHHYHHQEGARSPLGSPIRVASNASAASSQGPADDVRSTARDKSSRLVSTGPKPLPRGTGAFGGAPRSGGSPLRQQGSGHYHKQGSGDTRYHAQDSSSLQRDPVIKELLPDLDQFAGSSDNEAGMPDSGGGGGAHQHHTHGVSMSQGDLDDIMDAMSVQMFSPEQVSVMISGAEPQLVEGREAYAGAFKGMKVRVWKVPLSQSVSYLELRRAYSKYCIAHPNIAAVLGVCIQCCSQAGAGGGSGVGPGTTASASARASQSSLALLAGDDVVQDTAVGDVDKTTASLGGVEELAPGISLGGICTNASAAGGLGDGRHWLWVVEERFGDESLNSRLERGLLSWQQVLAVATDMCKALAFLQDLKRAGPGVAPLPGTPGGGWPSTPGSPMSSAPGTPTSSATATAASAFDFASAGAGGYATDIGGFYGSGYCGGGTPGAENAAAVVLSAYALRTIVTPSNVAVEVSGTKVSVLPALLAHLESIMPFDVAAYYAAPTGLGGLSGGAAGSGPAAAMASTPLHCDMAYLDPNAMLSDAGAPSFYAYGVVMLQLLTEHGPLGLLSAVREGLENATLMNLIPRLPANAEMQAWAEAYARLALRCTSAAGGAVSLEAEVLPALADLGRRLNGLGSKAMSWEQVEEMLMLPLQPRTSGDAANRRWVRQDFRMRRKMFLEEVAKLAVDGPIHKIEIRRSRCFKDAVSTFAGKGHAVWRQPLKVTFVGEAGMDSGGVTREWFSTLSSAISRGSPELFWTAGPQRNQLYINPLSSSPSHLKKFQFVGMFMAKAILESAARGKELGAITLNLSFCEPFWKLLLGIPLNLMDLQLLDPIEFRSLMTILNMDIDGLIFETFAWNFHHPIAAIPASTAIDSEAGTPTATAANAAHAAASTSVAAGGSSALGASARTTSGAYGSSPFASDKSDDSQTSIPLKPGGTHLKVTNGNKREYVLLKAHKMLVGAIEQQTTAVIDAFHSLIPRELVDKYSFTSLEMQLLVCGEQRIDVTDLKRHCKYEDGYSGREEVLGWFWDVVEGFDDMQRRQLLQFWSGSDGMPAEGFGALDPAFHIVAVERIYDANDTTARLPAAHTCFRQLDLPRYCTLEELRDKLVTAVTMGQGYMALS